MNNNNFNKLSRGFFRLIYYFFKNVHISYSEHSIYSYLQFKFSLSLLVEVVNMCGKPA